MRIPRREGEQDSPNSSELKLQTDFAPFPDIPSASESALLRKWFNLGSPSKDYDPTPTSSSAPKVGNDSKPQAEAPNAALDLLTSIERRTNPPISSNNAEPKTVDEAEPPEVRLPSELNQPDLEVDQGAKQLDSPITGNMEAALADQNVLAGPCRTIDPGFLQSIPEPDFTIPDWTRNTEFDASIGNGGLRDINIDPSLVDPLQGSWKDSELVPRNDFSENTSDFDTDGGNDFPLSFVPPETQYPNQDLQKIYTYPDPSQNPTNQVQDPYTWVPYPQGMMVNNGFVQPQILQPSCVGYDLYGLPIMVDNSGALQQPLYPQPRRELMPQYPYNLPVAQQQVYQPLPAPQVGSYLQQPQVYQPFPAPSQQWDELEASMDPTLYGDSSFPTGDISSPLAVVPEAPKNAYTDSLRKRKRRAPEISETSNDDSAEGSGSDYEPDGSAYSGSERTKKRGGNSWARRDSQWDPQQISRTVTYKAEVPKKVPDKTWVRHNNTTKGLSTRTGKINQYKPSYKDVAPPFHTWQSSSGFTYEYDTWGGLHQPTRGVDHQSKVSYTTEQIRDFIYEHPTDPNRNKKLVLWIQQVPADSVRRYPTAHGHTCRFHDCPERAYHRNIRSGYYQVAFDEKWTTHSNTTDPFYMAGYVHLYCLERFLDFPDICRKFDVRVDGRQVYDGEPFGEFSGSLLRKNMRGDEYGVAEEFVKSCKNGTLHVKYPTYPVHANTLPVGARKDHNSTLTYALTKEKNDYTTKSKVAKTEERGLKPSFIEVNFGDLQERVDYMKLATQRKRERAALGEDDEDGSGRKSKRKRGGGTAVKKKEAVKVEVVESSDEDGDDQYVGPRTPKRPKIKGKRRER